ncbi:MAG: UDP-N-acetylglucosamine 1-carboxyvinyltransferase [Oscillospiraceae bacterium]
MSILRIKGGKALSGTVRVHGAKNSVLPIIAASILCAGETVIHNCPDLTDVHAATKILRHLGCSAEMRGCSLYINTKALKRTDIPDALMREMRSSVIFLGAILARAGEATLSMPGGCELGPRPIDMHLAALRSMGAVIDETGGNILCHTAGKLCAARIDLSQPSVGATENSILAAAGCEGTTVITNAAREPEIWDLQEYLKKIGIHVSGALSSIVTVEGGRAYSGCEHSVIPDRIVATTYMAACAATHGKVEITGIMPEHIANVSDVFFAMGCEIKTGKDRLYINADRILRAPRPVVTRPYPGFPTDAQPPVMAACLMAEGTTAFIENIFQNRYRHISELQRMGADIKVEGRVAMVTGVQRLHGAPVAATDLRGGAALVIAALCADGESDVSGMHHLDRGYDRIEQALSSLGAEIERM